MSQEKTLILKLSPDRARQLYQALHVELDFITAKIRHDESTNIYKSAVAALSHWRAKHSEVEFLIGMLEGAASIADPGGGLLHYMQRGWIRSSRERWQTEEVGIASNPENVTASPEPLEGPQTHAKPRNASEAVLAPADASEGTPDGKDGETACSSQVPKHSNIAGLGEMSDRLFDAWDAYTAFPTREHDMGGEGGGA